MLIKQIVVLFTFLCCTHSFGQKNYNKLTIISHSYINNHPYKDTSIYFFETGTPNCHIKSWEHIGTTQQPIQYITFTPDRKKPLLTTKRNSKLIICKSFNDITNRWFISEKRQKKSTRKVVLWQTFYHEHHKMYFTTKTTMKFNKNGYLTQMSTYDMNRKQTELKEVFLYE